MRPKIIHIPRERPYCCAECPLLGKRPTYDVEPGSKFTLHCFLPDHQQEVSGRGSHQPDARFRCRPKVYTKVFDTLNGDIPIGALDYEKYRMNETAWLYERDTRLNKETQ